MLKAEFAFDVDYRDGGAEPNYFTGSGGLDAILNCLFGGDALNRIEMMLPVGGDLMAGVSPPARCRVRISMEVLDK